MILDRIRESRADHLLGIYEALEIANYHYFDRLMRQKPGETLVKDPSPDPSPDPSASSGEGSGAQPTPEPAGLQPKVIVGTLYDH